MHFREILLFSNTHSIDIRGCFSCVLKLANWRSSQGAVVIYFNWEVSMAWGVGHGTGAPAVWIFRESIMGARAERSSPEWVYIPEIGSDGAHGHPRSILFFPHRKSFSNRQKSRSEARNQSRVRQNIALFNNATELVRFSPSFVVRFYLFFAVYAL